MMYTQSSYAGPNESIGVIIAYLWRFFNKEMSQSDVSWSLIRWCDLIHSYGLKVFYHTDGAAEPLIESFINCGVDVLNPIQHTCPGMEAARLKRKYGDRIIFHGGVDNQNVLPFGSADDVRQEVRQLLTTLGSDGRGYICCSCHNVQANTSVQNILAMVDAVKRHGNATRFTIGELAPKSHIDQETSNRGLAEDAS